MARKKVESKLRGYCKHIQETTGCTDEEAPNVEELMRNESGGVLDYLTSQRFNRLAKDCLAALREIRTTEPNWTAR